MKKGRFLAYATGFAAAIAASATLAQAPAGFTVQSLKGDLRLDASAVAEGERAAKGTLTSGPGTQAVLHFDDGMEVRLEENTVLRLEEFASPSASEKGHVAIDVQAGVAQFKTGEIVRLTPDQFTLRTPQGNVTVLEPSEFSVAVRDSTIVDVNRGAVRVSNTLGDRVVRDGATLAFPAAAQSSGANTSSSPRTRRGWLGVSTGRSHIDGAASAKLIDTGSVNENSTGFKVFGGYQLHRYIGAELAYVDLGKLQYAGSFVGVPVSGGKLKLSGVDISALATLPLSRRAMVFGKAGLFTWRAEATDTFGGTAFSGKTSGRKPSLGLGASLAITPPIAIRAEIETFKFGDHHATLMSVGLVYNF